MVERVKPCKHQCTRTAMHFVSLLLCVSIVAARTSSSHRKPDTENLKEDGTTLTEMMKFMRQFGYLAPVSSNMIGELISGEEVSKAVRKVQKVAKLPETGILDDATAKYIKRPRCGNSDESLVERLTGTPVGRSSSVNQEIRRVKRYNINKYNVKWEKQELTWRMDKMTGKVNRDYVMDDMRRAFDLWSRASNLRFHFVDRRQADNEADIVVSFETGVHGDGYNFDGPGAVLAHAFMPTGSDIAGDLHLDETETWKSSYDRGFATDEYTSILWVATHELGHSLGLDHSEDPKAIMYPSYTGDIVHLSELPQDDATAIKMLYRDFAGSNQWPQQHQPQPTHPPTTRRPPVYQTRPPYQPVQTRRPNVIVPPTRPTRQPYTPYRNPWVPPTTPATTRRPYRPHHTPARTPRPPRPTRPTTKPQPTTTEKPQFVHPDICGQTFDALAAIRGELYIFKGKNMWKISSIGKMYGPTLVHHYWQGLPETIERIDAAYEKQVSPYSITLFSGNQYWVFNGNRLINGPIHLTHMGLPSNVHQLDGVLAWGHTGKTFFFSHDRYWKYDETIQRMEHGYPKSVDHWKGVEHPISSVFRWKDGNTYFFKDRLYWSFNDTTMEVKHATGMLTSSRWFSCPTTEDHEKEQDNSVNSDHLKGHGNADYSVPTDVTSANNKVQCSNTFISYMFTLILTVYASFIYY